jgi:hypothetical protein
MPPSDLSEIALELRIVADLTELNSANERSPSWFVSE